MLVAYPVAYAIALHGGRYKNALIAAIVVPFFASYLIRMYAWKALLSDDGLVNSGIRKTGLSDGIAFLNTPWAVIGGLVYGFVVFMILPVYASLERMDVSLIEAGKDLYHGPLRTFFTVTLPATRAGLYGGMLLVFLPALGDFVSAQLLGGPRTYMIGNLIQQQFLEGQNWPLGSAMTVAMMVALTVLMVVYLRATTDPRQGAVVTRPARWSASRSSRSRSPSLFFAWLYLPIVAVVLFSFNTEKSLAVFSGFSTRWYSDFFTTARCSARSCASLRIATVAALGSLVLGTMLALGLERITLAHRPARSAR